MSWECASWPSSNLPMRSRNWGESPIFCANGLYPSPGPILPAANDCCRSVFQLPWSRIIESVERIAQSHQLFADRLGNDVEQPLRGFPQRQDVQNMTNISNNLTVMARELDDARDKSDKLTKKGGKASTQKVDAASSKLESATQQWESQSPFIFETLQVLDESRVNLLRDLLTQFQTHESDRAQRDSDISVETLAMMLEISTEREVQSFVQKVTAGKAQLPPSRTATRRSTTHMSQNSAASQPSVPSTPNTSQPPQEDDASEHNSVPNSEAKPGKSAGHIWHEINVLFADQ